MQRKAFYFLGIVLSVFICCFWWYKTTPPKREHPAKLPALSLTKLPKSMQGLKLRRGTFSKLVGWENADSHLKDSIKALQKSCKVFLNRSPDAFVGSDYIALHARDWANVCNASKNLDTTSLSAVKEFFEYWFLPVEFVRNREIKGTFTGYYIPIVAGSLEKSDKHKVPLYTVPKNLISANPHAFIKSMPSQKIVGRVESQNLIPFYTREEIDKGALGNSSEILAYVETEIDRLKIETEGSAMIDIGNDDKLFIGFAGTNGATYKSIASILVDLKIFKKHEATMQNIKDYFIKYPEKLKAIINQNKSFVFFRKLPQDTVVGSQGVALTPEISLAVDRSWIPLGLPLWVTTTIYDKEHHEHLLYDRLMVAQDVGGSIKGVVRGDIYFGEGLKAEERALNMQSQGHYWLLLPRLDR